MPKKKKKQSDLGKRIALAILKSPYYLGKGIYRLTKKTQEVSQQIEVKKKRAAIPSNYESHKLLKTLDGDLKKWEDNFLKSDSKIGIILGARGSGKSAFGIKFLENTHAKKKRKCFAMGFDKNEMPSWIKVAEQVDQIQNDAIVLIDEGGILFSSRKSMSTPNKLLSDLILVARHKNLSILFISQNSSNLDVNIIRQADFLILKPSSLLQIDFERKKIKDIYKEVHNHFKELKENKGLTYIYADKFRGFVNSPLPSFWNQEISKSFK